MHNRALVLSRPALQPKSVFVSALQVRQKTAELPQMCRGLIGHAAAGVRDPNKLTNFSTFVKHRPLLLM